ncbi:DUF2585 family protein [Saccharopolyspora tripterygii]
MKKTPASTPSTRTALSGTARQATGAVILRADLQLCLLVVALMAAAEWAMGRVPYCSCGYVKLWHGVVMSSENSQHITDWFTLTHIMHGVGFYFLLWLLNKKTRLSFGRLLLLAVLLECGWEVLENTPWIIDRYRTATVSLDYYGDSVLNSVSDVLAMVTGFVLAKKAPVWASIAVTATLELLLMHFIRDGLILNVVMLIHPVESIRIWQSGA